MSDPEYARNHPGPLQEHVPEVFLGIGQSALSALELSMIGPDGLIGIPLSDIEKAAQALRDGNHDQQEIIVWTRRRPGSSDEARMIDPDEQAPPKEYLGGRLRIDPGRREVFIDDVLTYTTQKQFDILSLLTGYSGRVVTYQEIREGCWGLERSYDMSPTERIGYHIRCIRRDVLGEELGKHIVPKRGVGHKFEEDEGLFS